MMKLSIVTINYNNCEGLRKTIESVIAQTWKEFEWIIVDGGSLDGSRELIEKTAARLQSDGWPIEHFSLFDFSVEDWKMGADWPKIASLKTAEIPSVNQEGRTPNLLWCIEPDRGVYNAMNKGIAMASGEYCLFLNSGDRLYAGNTLSNISKKLLDSLDILVGRVLYPPMRVTKNYSLDIYSIASIYRNSLPHQASFIKTKLLREDGGYDENYKIVSDWKFFVNNIVWKRVSIDFCEQIIAENAPNGISSNSRLYQEETTKMRKEMFPQFFIRDLERSLSVKDVYEAGVISRMLYRSLYKLSSFLRKINKE